MYKHSHKVHSSIILCVLCLFTPPKWNLQVPVCLVSFRRLYSKLLILHVHKKNSQLNNIKTWKPSEVTPRDSLKVALPQHGRSRKWLAMPWYSLGCQRNPSLEAVSAASHTVPQVVLQQEVQMFRDNTKVYDILFLFL